MEPIRRQAGNARFITSICTGALILGAAGLLRGRRATTHRAFHELLGPLGAIPVRERVVRDGNLVTGGGITAEIDFALTFASELVGREEAQAPSRWSTNMRPLRRLTLVAWIPHQSPLWNRYVSGPQAHSRDVRRSLRGLPHPFDADWIAGRPTISQRQGSVLLTGMAHETPGFTWGSAVDRNGRSAVAKGAVHECPLSEAQLKCCAVHCSALKWLTLC